ncbi:GPW/gp25 family protein [[Eubacterium] cellulosolvens]
MANNKKDRYGKDLKMLVSTDKDGFQVSDLGISRTGDLGRTMDEETVLQAIRHRLSTRRGELTELGHPEYGSLLETVIGEPNTEDTHRIIETLVRDCLQFEPRIANIIEIEAKRNQAHHEVVDIGVVIQLRGQSEPIRVVYPLYLEETL